jgi:hypothetical protein
MTANIDAVLTASDIKSTYRRYLQSLLAVRDPKIDAALHHAIDTTPILDKGPLLEANPPYAPGKSINDLMADGVISPGFAALDSAALPLDRPLYVHQEQAIRKARAGRNILVATGTGSGKTESFLLPILDSLVREKERGDLGPGVRALLLYPMNALANDQMKRLRQLLAGYPEITFGRYTGDTATDPRKARDNFAALNIGEPILPNELLSRQEMRQTPPHILLTNFAMLEYLLLRPLDMDLFNHGDDSKWRFLVVDEAHVYDGSQGAEIAMLLRRVRDRVAPGRSIQCIATSATVGGDSDPSAVTTFATNLFGQPFEWVENDRERQDLVVATRVEIPAGPYWGPLSPSEYLTLDGDPDPAAAIRAAAKAAGWAGDVDGSSAVNLLLHEEVMAQVRKTLAAGPKPFDTVAKTVFGESDDASAGLAALVNLGSSLRTADGTTALSARYHLFLRATEGAYACLSEEGPHVHLSRHATCPDCESPSFEIASCKRCGSVHVVGTLESTPTGTTFLSRKSGQRPTWFVLDEHEEVEDEDETVVEQDGGNGGAGTQKLCTACAAVADEKTTACPGCGSRALRTVRKLKDRGEDIAGCLVCGARGSATVRVLDSGADASGAVITTSLYQRIPPSSNPDEADIPGEGRKLLAFSDSRQAAAYFAPYLESSYSQLQRRRLIMQGLQALHADEEAAAVDDVVFKTRSAATKVRQFKPGQTAQQQSREVAPWVMAEVVAIDDRQSLEGLGLLRVELFRDPAWPAPKPLLDLGLTQDEAWAFLQELLRTLRQQGAVTMPEESPANHEIFAPRLGPIRARLEGPEPQRKVLAWLPGKGSNRRIDYTKRLLAKLGNDADPADLLRGIWNFLTAPTTKVAWLKSSTEPTTGVTFQVDHELLRFTLVGENNPTFECCVCRRVSPVSVRGLCAAMGCEGELVPFVPPTTGDRDHYRTVYRSMKAVPLTSLEHTAQWSNQEAATIQQKFIRGEVNALSCSTTFELGVDVGELQAVMLRNMPPTTANYVQRAGRAGRRAGAAALVVTYAQRRSHDLTRFNEPEVMISGAVRAPYVPLENERIDRRHAHSVALAAFFRWQFDTTGRIDNQAGAFFLGDDANQPSVGLVKGFLDPIPAEITDALRRILPPAVAKEIDVDEGGWVDVLLDLLERARVELEEDVKTIEALQDQAVEAKNFNLADRYKRVTNTLRRRQLVGHLANRNVLPKYGFPVDTVELRTNFGTSQQLGSLLDLSRDLSQAIYEYAPDATIVAGGQLWTSRGVYRLPGRELVEQRYHTCRACNGFWSAIGQLEPQCPHCDTVTTDAPRTFTVPEFGFVAARETTKPGPRPPQRSWSGSVHILAAPPETTVRNLTLPGGTVKSTVGARGSLVAIADGPGARGFWVCDWCGNGESFALTGNKPPTHKHPIRDIPCKGRSACSTSGTSTRPTCSRSTLDQLECSRATKRCLPFYTPSWKRRAKRWRSPATTSAAHSVLRRTAAGYWRSSTPSQAAQVTCCCSTARSSAFSTRHSSASKSATAGLRRRATAAYAATTTSVTTTCFREARRTPCSPSYSGDRAGHPRARRADRLRQANCRAVAICRDTAESGQSRPEPGPDNCRQIVVNAQGYVTVT